MREEHASTTSGSPLTVAITFSIALYGCLQFFFLNPLEKEAHEMHEKQMDPTEIVQVPYQLERLGIFVGGVVFVLSLLPSLTTPSNDNTNDDWWHVLGQFLQLTLLCFGVMILCGASPQENLLHTALAALYLTACAWFEPPIFAAQQQQQKQQQATKPPPRHFLTAITHSPSLLQRVLERFGAGVELSDVPSGAEQIQQEQRRVATTVTYSCLGCTIPLPILLLYDRGWQVQRWPVPVILGGTYGLMIGTVLGTVLALFRRTRSGRRDHRHGPN